MTLLYADASALVKLVIHEPESDALRATLAAATVVSSELAAVELAAVVRRQRVVGGEAQAAAIVRRLTLLPLSPEVVAGARADPTEPPLRTLDLLHLATARALRRRTTAPTVVAYDGELLAAARADGFAVLAPSAPASS